MNKGAVALLALAAMACVSTPAMAAKKAKSAMSLESCNTFLAAQEAAASGAVAAPAGGLTVDGCKAVVAKDAELQAYRAGFAEAANVNDLELFIDMFKGNDPDKLVPKAKARLKEMKAQEAKEAAEAAAAAAAAPAPAPAAAPAPAP